MYILYIHIYVYKYKFSLCIYISFHTCIYIRFHCFHDYIYMYMYIYVYIYICICLEHNKSNNKLINFDGGPGSRGPGPTFTPCRFAITYLI